MILDAHEPRTRISPFFGSRRIGAFTPERVWIEDGDRHPIADLAAPRASFAGHALTTRWNELQYLYFTSYALWNYFTTPFVFAEPGFAFEELADLEDHGDVLHRVRVAWPARLPSHADQTFYFTTEGHLARIDYTTDIAGGVATHFTYDRKTFGGLVFPTLRRVVARRERPLVSGPTAVLLRVADVVVA